jgi:RNA polymerase sigma-70 factor (ECF subfamily)
MCKESIHRLIENLFRHESGKITSHLIKKFGADKIIWIQDAVQHSMLRAMQTWPIQDIPRNPSGWVLRVAQNYLIDHHRKKSSNTINIVDLPVEPEIDDYLNQDLDKELKDDELRMMFACCHPQLSIESQLILTLKILCGFSNKEVASALFKSDEAIAKAYTRAKLKFQQVVPNLEVPLGKHLNDRLEVILKVIYVMFNEGYNSISEDELIREDLCSEANRLADLLLEQPLLRKPKVHALKALICFQSSRFKARISREGEILNLESQNRKLWDQSLIQKGMEHLQISYAFGNISEYHIEASIAAYHATAISFSSTDWESIYNGYQLLEKIKPSAMVTLNRIVAESRFKGAIEALQSLENTNLEKRLKGHYLYYAVKADLLVRIGSGREAVRNYHQAVRKTTNRSEQIYLEKKISELKNKFTTEDI